MASIHLVVPCGARKGPHPAPAAQLYTGPHFRYILRQATAEAELHPAGQVLILSALHGLITTTQVIAPYDLRIGAPGSITAGHVADQARQLGIRYGDEVYALLPRAYLAVLDEALRTFDIPVQDVYEAAPGIGYQRAAASRLGRTTTHQGAHHA